ncbi:flagellar filament capping protein FliD [Cohnella sp. CFH 77786]|uniref:flagellar filament capping protein FliD n=1 Tax=Cohnella sp. CFH 77786 TaxID=2662265 RepID=UPI001C60AFFB|nr:flagellar filament capping protein FliD [Cohnella sp. CFH 77786]MBW5448471.1 flagellar filament capping protein FliD [Cohnella sp. CFH 77786]
MVTRISGINSGLDIDKMVSDLMKAERMPLDKLKQKKTTLTWTTDLYREINTKLSSFKNVLDTMRLSGDWKQYKGTSSNEDAVTISADSTASAITHSVTVTGLASGANLSSSAGVTDNSLVGGTAPNTAITAGVNDQLNVTLGGVTKKITLTANASYTNASLVTELQTQIDNAFGANKIQVSLNGSNLELKSVGTAGNEPQVIMGSIAGNNGLTDLGFTDGQSNKINVNAQLGTIASKFTAGTLTFGDFKINGVSISYTSTDTLSSIMTKVNNSAAGVNMSYDDVTDKIVFTTKGTGQSAQVSLQNGSAGNFLTAMRLSTTPVTGTDANVTIDGVQSYRSSNTFTTGGVTYTLKQTTASPVTVGVNVDIDSTVDKIKNFVAKYNETIELMNKRVKETKFRDYAPLTDDQKKAMEEDDIKLWEDKAKSGLLRNDDIVKSTINDLRTLVSTSVGSASSTYNALYKIGITTVPYNSSAPQDAGKLVLDESALRTALSQDPSNVTAVFSSQPDGISQKMYDRVTKTITDLVKKAGGAGTVVDSVTTDLGNKIHTIDSQISDFDVRLAKKEDYYYKMFAAMDQAVGKSNAQLSWMMQQFK